jgi:DNA-binding CsgD family transcriptional regulator
MSGGALQGRIAELEAFAGALDAVAQGEPRLLTVRGEAGIGKTRLLAELHAQATAQRFAVVEGRATELEQDLPLVPIVDALESQLPAPDVLSLLGPQRLGLLAEVLPGLAATTAPAASAERWRLHRALGELLALVADDRPVLLLIDDVHWADPATLELLEHLIRRPPTPSLLVALGARPGPAAERLLVAQRASAAVGLVALDLRPLDRDDAEALLAPIADAAERERCFAQSGGNPLLLGELAREGGAQTVPGGVVAAVAQEIASLPADARALAEGAAIAGDPFAFDVAARIAGLDDAAALDALDVITAHELVRATDAPREFAFRHPVVRTAVYEGLGAGARLAGHAAAARELRGAGAPAAVQAHHLAHAAAPGDSAAATTLREGATAIRSQAPVTAADWLLAAQRADAAGTDHLQLADALAEVGRLDAALQVVDDPRAPTSDVRLAIAAAAIERALGRHDAAGARLQAALKAAAPGSADADRILVDLAVGAYKGGDYRGINHWAEQITSSAEHGAAARAATAALLAVGGIESGDPGGAAASVASAVAMIHEAGDHELAELAEPAIALSWGLLAMDRLADGLDVARRIAAATRRAGHGSDAIQHDLAAVLALSMLGRLGEAVAAADEVEQAARISGNPQTLQTALWMRAWVLLEAGQLDPALALANESVTVAAGLDDSSFAIVARAVLGAVLATRGEHQRGRDLLVAYDLDRGWVGRWAPLAVQSYLALGDVAGARAHAARATADAAQSGLPGPQGAATRAEALVALADGDAERAAALARRAVDRSTAAGAMLEAARGTLVAGRALIVTDRDAGIAELEAAAAQAEACDAPRVHDAALRELRRAGVRVGRGGQRAPGDAGLDALSPREREMAELVAEGLTNREIAARVFLSEKTVETHLTRVFQKLGVKSRAQVAAEVARN